MPRNSQQQTGAAKSSQEQPVWLRILVESRMAMRILWWHGGWIAVDSGRILVESGMLTQMMSRHGGWIAVGQRSNLGVRNANANAVAARGRIAVGQRSNPGWVRNANANTGATGG